ncbi:MAG TPA: chemotaxis protein CheW [Steroidobacteraceae bacterium]|nr:chemotaxis protein CheW [Steroidobacteraceae bacterium]
MNAAELGRDHARWVLFALDAGRFALPLAAVERVVRAAEVTPLPKAPDVVLGALDVAGDILPVFSVRRRLALADRGIRPADQFVIARTGRRRVVLAVDTALGLADDPGTPVPGAALAPGLAHIRGIMSGPDGLVLIHDLERFLSDEEARELDAALRDARHRRGR